MTVKDFCNMWHCPMWNARQMVQVMDMRGCEVGYFDRWDILEDDTPEARDIAMATIEHFNFKDEPKPTSGSPKQCAVLYCDL